MYSHKKGERIIGFCCRKTPGNLLVDHWIVVSGWKTGRYPKIDPEGGYITYVQWPFSLSFTNQINIIGEQEIKIDFF